MSYIPNCLVCLLKDPMVRRLRLLFGFDIIMN